jgi:hypothetical protein
MTPAEAYETIDEAYRERLAIVLVDGYPEDAARQTANTERAKREVDYLTAANYQDRTGYLEMVGKKRGRLDMRMLMILYENTLRREKKPV